MPTGECAQGGQPARHGTLGVTLSGPSSCHCSSDRAAGTSGPGRGEPARGAAFLRPEPRDTYGIGRAQTRTGPSRALRVRTGPRVRCRQTPG
jgi:hypothetical protein